MAAPRCFLSPPSSKCLQRLRTTWCFDLHEVHSRRRTTFLVYMSVEQRVCTHGLGLLVENGLGLTTVTGLLTVVTTLTLSGEGVLALLVLGDLVRLVLAALLRGAESTPGPVNVSIYPSRRGRSQAERE